MSETNGGKAPGMAIASMVLGIVAVVLSCCYYLSIPCAILAIIFGILVLRRGPEGKKMAIAGIICGAVTVVLVIILIASAGVLAGVMAEYPEFYEMYEGMLG